MLVDSTQDPKRKSRAKGFSTVELLVAMGIITLMTAVALPSFVRSYRRYQLSDSAYKVAGILKFAHYEAVRLNVTPLAPFVARVSNNQAQAGTYVFADSNNNGTVDQVEKQALFAGAVKPVPSGTPPNTGGLAAAVGVAVLTNISPTNGAIQFDQRGALVPPSVSVLYVGNTDVPTLGYRAIVVLPTGSIQVWRCDTTGTWIRDN